MAGQTGTLEIIGREVATALAVLDQRLNGNGIVGLFSALGYIPAANVVSAANGAIQTTKAAAGSLPAAIDALTDAIDAGNAEQIVLKGGIVLQGIASVISSLSTLAEALKDADAGDNELSQF